MEVSIIVPVLNEADGIAEMLRMTGKLGAHEVIVADGGSSDGTREIAQSFGAIIVQSEPGRGPQMNAGAAIATGNVFLFLHADVRLEESALSQLTLALGDQNKNFSPTPGIPGILSTLSPIKPKISIT